VRVRVTSLSFDTGATSVILRLNKLSGGSGPSSLLLTDNAKGFVKENTITGAKADGVCIAAGADPDMVSTPPGLRVIPQVKG